MARELESDRDLEREHLDVWLESLISRKLALEEEEKNRKKLQTAIYRVDPSLREVKEDHFDCKTLHLGLVSKIERPARVRDTLELDVVIEFLSDIGKHPHDWRSISKKVVPDPDAMKRIYNEHCRLSDDSIRFILAQDAIFLACFLIYFFRSLPSSTLRKTCDFFSRQSRRLRLVLLKDICKLENQIPLELVKNVIMIVFQSQTPDLLEEDCQVKASESLEKICSRFVHTLGAKFPSSQFLTTQVAVTKAKQLESTFGAVGEISTNIHAEGTSTKVPVEETLSNVDAEKTSRNVAAQDNTRHNSEASSHHVIDVPASVEAKETGRQSLLAIGRLLKSFSLSAYKETSPTGSARMTELLVSGPALTDIRAKASTYEETPPINSPIVSQAPEASSTRYLLDSRRHMTDGSAEALGMDAQARETDHQCFIKCVFKQLRFPISLRKTNPLLDPQASKTPATNTQTVQFHKCQHLLHCLAEVFWNEAKGSGSKELRQSQNLWDHRLPSTATELHKCGIELRGHKEFLPKFEGFSVRRMGATLYLPQIKVIDDDTEEFWRNLLAFEDAYMKQDERRSLMSSLQFMNDLINTEEDVQLLLTGKNPVIIKNGLADQKAVVQMFKSVLQNHFPACNAEWASIRREISAYYESMFKRGVAEFCHSINKWWLCLGLIAAVLVFIATFGSFISKMVEFLG